MTVTYTPDQLERVDEIIKRNDIRFIRLQFSDIIGIAKHVTIPIGHWDEATSHGIWFDGSSIEGFARIAESDSLGHGLIDSTRDLRCLYSRR